MARFDSIVTVLTAASSNNLTDLATVKTELGIPTGDTGNDVWLANAITWVSGSIADHCNRIFVVQDYQEVFTARRGPFNAQIPGPAEPLELSYFPLANFAELTTGADTPSGSVLPFASTALGAITDNKPVGGPSLAVGTTLASHNATSATLSTPVTADVPSGSVFDFGLSVVQTPPQGTATVLAPWVDYAVDPATGRLWRLASDGASYRPWEAWPLKVVYSGGYAAMPSGLVGAALRWITMRYSAKQRDPMLKRETQPGLGEMTYETGAPDMKGAVPMEIEGMLAAYRPLGFAP